MNEAGLATRNRPDSSVPVIRQRSQAPNREVLKVFTECHDVPNRRSNSDGC